MLEAQSVLVRVKNFVRRNIWWILAVLVVLWAVLLRYAHVLDHNYYYVLSPDSYFFHWRAARLAVGQGPPLDATASPLYSSHIGLAGALAYLSKGAQLVFHMSPDVALDFSCKVLPVVLGVVSLIMVFIIAYRFCGRRVGIFSAFASAGMAYGVFNFASGYLDRDGLSALLIMVGVFSFYSSKYWKIKIQGRNIGWLLGGVVLLMVQILLYWEWSFEGSVLLAVIILAYFILRTTVGYWNNAINTSARTRLISALRQANWKTFAFILAVYCLAAAAIHPELSGTLGWIRNYLSEYSSGVVQEYRRLTLGDLLGLQLWWVPVAIGVFLAVRKRTDYVIFVSLWFLVILGISLFVARLEWFMGAPAALLAGVGLDFLWQWGGAISLRSLKGAVVVALILLVIVFGTIQGAGMQKTIAMAADTQWQEAMRYLREDTPASSVVASQWTYGYWILDLGQRRPFVDNGFYGYDNDRLGDVGRIYAATDDSEAVGIMKSRGIDYIVFSKLDTAFSSTIMGWVGKNGLTDFPRSSLFVRSWGGNFTSDDGLEVVYRSPVSEMDEVVILRLDHQATLPDSGPTSSEVPSVT
jgi:asparagine N-glycosylation enzyme membrane subunit Stt3